MQITITMDYTHPRFIAVLAAIGGAPNAVEIASDVAQIEKPKATRGKAKPAEPAASTMSPEDVELAREIAADVAEAPPEPEGAKQVVDAGTGRPAAPAAEVVLTMDEVRANATRLAQSNAPQLKAILGEFGAAKLSEVPADKLPDFAGKVLEALG